MPCCCCCGYPRGSAGPAPGRGLEYERGGDAPLMGRPPIGGRGEMARTGMPFVGPTFALCGCEGGCGDLAPPAAVGREDGTAALGAARPAPLFSAALMISSSKTLSAAQRTIHSTMSSLPSPKVCHTAFSSGDFPVMVTLVPPPPPEPCAAFF